MALLIDRPPCAEATVIALRGDLDLDSSHRLRQVLRQAIDESPRGRVVVDLEGLDFVDSVGLGVLVGGLKRARTNEGDLVLVATGRNVLRVLELTGLTRVFEIHPHRDAAMASAS